MFFKSIEKLAVVDPGADGAAGTVTPDTDDIFADYLVSQSFNVNMPKGNVIREWRDGSDAPSIAIAGRSEGAAITFRLERLSNDLMKTFLGGTLVSGTTGDPIKFTKSSARETIYKTVIITATAFGGEQLKWEIPYGLMSAGLVGSPTKDAEGKVELDCQYEALVPVDATGAVLPIWTTWDLNDTSST